MNEPILIVGASARQCAQSAVRAGYSVVAIDLFADWDLLEIATSFPVREFNSAELNRIKRSAAQWPKQFLICSGMEKRVDLIRKIGTSSQLIGTQPNDIARSNDVFAVASWCNQASIRFPEVVEQFAKTKRDDRSWLAKPILSSGGSGVRYFTRNVFGTTPPETGDYYLQRFVSGKTYSSVFCSNGHSTGLIGSSIQLVGREPFIDNEKKPFAYSGSIGPVEFCSSKTGRLTEIGDLAATEFNMKGVFGLDWILDSQGEIWLIEINPRITASAELFEFSEVVPSVVDVHINTAQGNSIPTICESEIVFGKAIIYSRSSVRITVDENLFQFLVDNKLESNGFGFTDIPQAGSVIMPGQPIVSTFATGIEEDEVLDRLTKSVFELFERNKKLEVSW